LDESRQSGREKDSSAGRLRTRVRQLEEALENACRETQDKEARREREYKMLQDVSSALILNYLSKPKSLVSDCLE
jgi:predicted nucleic acid-binding Zn ribbon protein